MIQVGIIGGSGYVAGELLRTLVLHPQVKIDFVYSHSQPGLAIDAVHDDWTGPEDLHFTDQVNPNVDVLFLCLGHGHSSAFLEKHKFNEETRIIDLSNDFRLNADSSFQGKQFIYGLPELNKRLIKSAQYIANPGCFATAIQLALLPLAQAQALQSEIHIHAITGSTGAGQAPSATSHFSWRNNNLSLYKSFKHQHLGEIKESLDVLQKDFNQELNFLPLRGDFTRGIFASIYLKSKLEYEELNLLYQDYYADAPFVQIKKKALHLKQVINTNNAFLQIEKIEGKILITSIIDNLLKGAAGQAIQNMNLMFGLDESTGLQLKASYF